jgi:hypothetical protein
LRASGRVCNAQYFEPPVREESSKIELFLRVSVKGLVYTRLMQRKNWGRILPMPSTDAA